MEVISDAQFVKAVLRGEKEEFAHLVRRYEAMVRASVNRIVRDMHAAQDVTQAAFVKAYVMLARLRNPSAFGAWILKIARHQAMRTARQRKSPSPLVESMVSGPANDPAQNAEDGDLQLADAVANLPAHERVVISLHYFQELSLAQVSAVLNRPLGTVTKQLSRAHARLREQLRSEP